MAWDHKCNVVADDETTKEIKKKLSYVVHHLSALHDVKVRLCVVRVDARRRR